MVKANHALSNSAQVNLYNTTLSNTLDAYAPVITKTIKSRPLLPWYSVEVNEARGERRKAERKWRRTRCDLLTFKLKKTYATKLMNNIKALLAKIVPIRESCLLLRRRC